MKQEDGALVAFWTSAGNSTLATEIFHHSFVKDHKSFQILI
jgi:hypothetical protein